MDKDTLKRYRRLLKERDDLQSKIDKLYRQIEKLPDISDKVEASQNDYPYIRIHIPVKAKPPREVKEIRRLIRINEERRKETISALLEIETFIASIKDSEDRQIFEAVFIHGKTYREAGEELNMDASTVYRHIEMQLATNATK